MIYGRGGAWIHETREPQVLYPEACPADMSVTKLVSPPSVAPGQAIEWIVSVINDGSALARDVVMEDTLPAGFTVTGFDATGGGAVCQ